MAWPMDTKISPISAILRITYDVGIEQMRSHRQRILDAVGHNPRSVTSLQLGSNFLETMNEPECRHFYRGLLMHLFSASSL
jgi:hypothetical protein